MNADTDDNAVLILFDDGSTVPFDEAELQRQIFDSCLAAAVQDPNIAADIALSIEYALMHKFRYSQTQLVKCSEIDAMIVRILESIGRSAIAHEYRKQSTLRSETYRIPVTKLSCFLEQNLSIHGEELEKIANKVFNTMKSIGADASSGPLILELAKHFMEVQAGKIKLNIKMPDFKNQHPDLSITYDEIAGRIDEAAKIHIRKRILFVHTVNLQIFPSLRIDIRLSGLAANSNLIAPLTELALAPMFYSLGRAIDEICLRADEICKQKEHEQETPLKLIVNFSDASVFTGEWMGCRSTSSCEKCAIELGRLLSTMLTRQPIKFTFN